MGIPAPTMHARLRPPLGLSLTLLALILGSVANSQPIPVTSVGGGAPFTDSWKQIVARDMQWQADVAAGRVIAPPSIRSIHDQKMRYRKVTPIEKASGSPMAIYGGDLLDPNGAVSAPQAPQVPVFGFAGLSLVDTAAMGLGWIPPDTCGAIGPDHFVELINGAMAIYDRSGTLISAVTDQSFFTVVAGGVTYPRNGSFDPRILYDRRSARWYATELEFGPTYGNGDHEANHVMFAMSRTSDPTGVWDKYVIPIGKTAVDTVHYFSDFDTLGTDSNGVYFAVRMFPTSGSGFARLVGTQRTPLLASPPSMGTIWYGDVTDMYSTPQPAFNMDAMATNAPAWFVASSATTNANMVLHPWTWDTSGTPSIGALQTLTTPAYGAVMDAPAAGSTTNIDSGDDRIQGAVIRKNLLWASRTIGVNATGGSTSVNRTAVEYIVANVSTTTAALAQSGRKWDSAANSPLFFYYPSVVPSGQGHAAIGFSDSNGQRWVAAATCGRLMGESAGYLHSVSTLQDGLNSYTRVDSSGRNRWGDYSYTSLDPNDDMTIWTIQEYAFSTANRWGTYITKLAAPAPVLKNPNAYGIRGTTKLSLTLSGSGFYDPGVGFRNRLKVAITGGRPNGVSVNRVTWVNVSTITILFDIDITAELGPRTIVVTNPDGQSDSVAGGFFVKATTSLALKDAAGQRGQTVTLGSQLVDTTVNTPVDAAPIIFSIDGAAQGSATTDATGVAKFPYTIAEGLGGTAVIGGSFNTTDYYIGSTAAATLTVNRSTTSLYVAAPVPTANGAYIRIYAYLKRTTPAMMLQGKTVNFTFNGVAAGSGTTDVNGLCEVWYLIPSTLPAVQTPVGASFDGDATNLPCSKSGLATVNAGVPTSIFSNSASGGIGSKVAFYAYLWRTSDHAMLGGRQIRFHVDGVPVGVATTDAGGYARITYQIPVGTVAGAHPVLALFRGDDVFRAVSRTTTLTTSAKFGVSMSCGSRSGVVGLPIRLYSYLWRTLDGAIPIGRTITFLVDGTAVGTGTTDDHGYAFHDYTIPVGTTVGSHPIMAQFAGDTWLDPGSASSVLRVAAKDTIAWFLANVTGRKGYPVTLYGYIKSATTGLPISGRTVTFKIDGGLVGSSVSATNGYIGVSYMVPAGMVSGPHPILAEFAGDTAYNAGSKTATLTVP